jgi:hypothetical protein
LSCGGLESTKWDFAFSFFERTFRNFGLLTAIGTDSGTLFAAPCAVFGLSRLAVWQLRLGIQIQRIKPWRAPIPAMSVHPRPAVYQPPPEPEYAYNDRAVWATRCGRICIGRRKIKLSIVFAGQIVGSREVDHQIWQVSFLDYDLGHFDNETGRVEPGPNPFTPENC